MYVKINVLYVHCTAYILHIIDLARALVFNAAHSTLHKFPLERVIDNLCTSYGFPLPFDYIFIMYSEFTALFTHSTQRTCTVSCIIYALCNAHIDNQLYFGIILHYIQNVCKNKCAVRTLYSVHIAYFMYTHCTISLLFSF